MIHQRPFDALRLFRDHGIQLAPAGHKHTQQGWVNTVCPFCSGNPGYHLGYNVRGGFFRCWRCGWKPTFLTLATLLHVPEYKVRSLVTLYPLRVVAGQGVLGSDNGLNHTSTTPLKKPPGSCALKPAHVTYLHTRKFDHEKLVREWDLSGIGPVSWPGWKWRIFIPINFEHHMVSYQTRSIHGSREDKYRACPKEFEILEHKHVLYGLDKCAWRTCVVVEGVTGVWRLGPGACATFGTQVKASQRVLLRRFKRLFIIFDTDEHGAGQEAGEKLAWQMSGYGLEVHQITLDHGDTGEMKQDDADHLMYELGVRL